MWGTKNSNGRLEFEAFIQLSLFFFNTKESILHFSFEYFKVKDIGFCYSPPTWPWRDEKLTTTVGVGIKNLWLFLTCKILDVITSFIFRVSGAALKFSSPHKADDSLSTNQQAAVCLAPPILQSAPPLVLVTQQKRTGTVHIAMGTLDRGRLARSDP